jgi:WW domain-binding protein 4
MSSQQQKRRAPWQNVERHYCAVCNAWMGSDRQSIMLHENAKKHQQNAELALLEKRKEKKQEEEANKFLADSLRQMEQAAMQATGMAHSATHPQSVSTFMLHQPVPQPVASAGVPSQPKLQKEQKQGGNDKQQLKEWQTRKKQKEEERKKRKDQEGDDEKHSQPANKRRKIAPGEGHYNDGDNKTYIEGQVFYGLLESDMPVQLWTGPILATPQEKRLPANTVCWKNALVLSVRQSKNQPASNNTQDVNDAADDLPIVNVTFLASPDAEEETIVKNVALDRIRIQLGADRSIPGTLEEARLLAMGGEIVEEASAVEQVVDEATGLSGWSTVSVKKTTVRQYDREEKEQAAEKLRQARLDREVERRKMEERRLEEAKVSNADDSALGAYDVWGKGDYKGIDISKVSTLSVEDTAKKLSSGNDGGPVSFRKAKKKNKWQRRKTNIDDD